MKRFLIFVLILNGCVSIPKKIHYLDYAYLPLSKFSPQNLKIDILSRTISCNIKNKNFKFILNTPLCSIEDNLYLLEAPVILRKGKVFLPKSFENYFKKRAFQTIKYKRLKIEHVVLDPGHGGKDPGAISKRGLKEKDVVLDICRRIKRILEKEGIKVTLTRTTDKFLTLKERTELANRAKADLFLSIHANANRSSKLKGFEIYFYSPKITDPQALLTYRLEEKKYIKESRLKKILCDMILSEKRAETFKLAEYLIKSLRAQNIRFRTMRGAPFYVLRNTYIPALLLEVGYLTNPTEEKFLRNPYYREQLAEAISQSIISFNKDFGERIIQVKK